MKKYLLMGAVACLSSQLHAGAFDCNDCVASNNTQWYVNADFLWWKAVEDSLPVAIVVDEVGISESASILNPKFKWDPGFRIGLGYRPCGCDWDFFANWTHFDTKASRSFSEGDLTETIIPQFGSLAPFGASDAVLSSTWHLHLNWADFELNRTFCVDQCFQWGIHAGLRAAWIDQKIDFSLTNASTGTTNNLDSKSDYSSLGLVAGLDASWLFGCGFSVNASAGGALLYGRQKSSVSETTVVAGAATSSIDGSSNYYISRAMTDLSFGLGWEGCVCDTMTLALDIDWEHHILFCQNQFPRGSSTAASRPRDGDLTMQGLTVSATLFF